MKTFEKGARVVLVAESNLTTHNEYEDDDCTRGVVKSVDKDGKLTVKWDSSWRTTNPSKHDASELMAEEEANKILDKLEAEYEVWAGPIREKIKEAAKLLAEADKLANKQKRDLTEMHEIVGPLIGAMDDVGWRTSSLSC
jgi:hypothetical protein